MGTRSVRMECANGVVFHRCIGRILELLMFIQSEKSNNSAAILVYAVQKEN